MMHIHICFVWSYFASLNKDHDLPVHEFAVLLGSYSSHANPWSTSASWLQFVGASMGTTDLKIPQKDSTSSGHASLPARVCCVVVVVVEYLAGGTLKRYLIRNSERKLAYKDVVRLASDLSRG